MKLNAVLETATKGPESAFRFLIMIIGILLIFGSIVYSTLNLYRIFTFEQINAEVASIEKNQTSGKTSAIIYSIWVSFDLPKQMVYTEAGKSFFYSPYKKGDIVKVYYNPQNPNEVFINSFVTIWFVPIVFLYLPGFSLFILIFFGVYKSFSNKL